MLCSRPPSLPVHASPLSERTNPNPNPNPRNGNGTRQDGNGTLCNEFLEMGNEWKRAKEEEARRGEGGGGVKVHRAEGKEGPRSQTASKTETKEKVQARAKERAKKKRANRDHALVRGRLDALWP